LSTAHLLPSGYTQAGEALLPSSDPGLRDHPRESTQREQVTCEAEAAHDAAAGGRRDAVAAEWFPRRNVREMNLHDRNRDRGDCIGDCV